MDQEKLVEMMATTCLCYISGLIDTTIGNFGTAQSAAYAAVSSIFLLSLFILAIAPGSGGHINPLITFSTMITGLTGFSRGILYMMAQTIGAALAGGTLRGSFGAGRAIQWQGGGCFREPGTVTSGQALLIETMCCFVLLVLAFGVALDPRQQKLMGPVFGPLAVGSSLGLVVFASGGLVPGYSGAGANPARCFAFAVARHNFKGELKNLSMSGNT